MYCDIPILGRCCFCLPIRQGVLIIGYLNMLYAAFMLGAYSYFIHNELDMYFLYQGAISELPSEICVAMRCLDIVCDACLVYGTHMKRPRFIKVFYYYTLATMLLTVVVQLIAIFSMKFFAWIFEACTLVFAALSVQVYLLMLVRSLLHKCQGPRPEGYENPLQQIVTAEANKVYNNTTVANEPSTSAQ